MIAVMVPGRIGAMVPRVTPTAWKIGIDADAIDISEFHAGAY